MSALFSLLQLVLRLTPRLLWWAVAGLVFGCINLVFSFEIWPNTPPAVVVFKGWTIIWAVLLPWLVARVVWLVAEEVESFFWKALWRLAAIGSYGGAALLTLVAFIGLLFNL